MRSFKSFTTHWPISALCIAVLLGPLLLGLFQSPVSAQTGTIEVAVVDFRNASEIPDPAYAKNATDAVVVELFRTGKFSVTADNTVKSKMVDLGYKKEDDAATNILLNEANLQRLGQEIGASSVITGDITSIVINEKKKVAEVTLAVRMLDVASGAWINGSASTGISHARVSYEGQSDSDLINEAVNDASRKVVESMVSYIIPEATIIGTIGTNDVLLNRGSQTGIKKGMEMIVMRRADNGVEEVVGKIRVTSVTDTDSNARILNAPRGITPGDQTRAIYALPEIGSKGTFDVDKASNTEKRINKSKNLLYSVGAFVLASSFFKGSSGRTEKVGNAIAVSAANPDVGMDFSDTGILILFNSLGSVRTEDIIEYHIWRDNKGTFPIADGGTTDGVGPVAIADEFTAMPFNGMLGSFDHFMAISSGRMYESLSAQYPSSDNTSIASVTHSNIEECILGKSHQFWITCLYQRANPSTGAYTYWLTTPSYIGNATHIERPRPDAPGGVVANETVNLDNITFRWYGSLGANNYVFEMCPFPDFRRDATWTKSIYQATPQQEMLFSKTFGYTFGSDPDGIKAWIDNMRAIGKLTSEDPVVYWRVGAKNNADKYAPYPSGPSPQKDGDKNTRYIYSDPNNVFSFNTEDDVPPPPE